jgi:signal peptidase I
MGFFSDLKKCETLNDCQYLFDLELNNIRNKSVYKEHPEKLDNRVRQLLTDIDAHMSNSGIVGYIIVPDFHNDYYDDDFSLKNINFYKKMFYWMSPFIISVGMLLIFSSIFKINVVSGHSMDPTLRDGTYLVSNKLSNLNRFDIVVAQELDENNKTYGVVKRVIGLPGDVIEYDNDVLKINGQVYEEPYLYEYISKFKSGELEDIYNYDERLSGRAKYSQSFTTQDNDSGTGLPNLNASKFKVIVPDEGYYLIGDNRLVSKDSRQVGAFPRSNIVGKVILSNIGK